MALEISATATSTVQDGDEQQLSLLLQLPGELRNRIYRLVLRGSEMVHVLTRSVQPQKKGTAKSTVRIAEFFAYSTEPFTESGKDLMGCLSLIPSPNSSS